MTSTLMLLTVWLVFRLIRVLGSMFLMHRLVSAYKGLLSIYKGLLYYSLYDYSLKIARAMYNMYIVWLQVPHSLNKVEAFVKSFVRKVYFT